MTGRDWAEIFTPGTILYLKEQVGAHPSSSLIKIVDTSDTTDSEGEWPQALTLRGRTISDEARVDNTKIDNINIREAIERGDIEVVQYPIPITLSSENNPS